MVIFSFRKILKCILAWVLMSLREFSGCFNPPVSFGNVTIRPFPYDTPVWASTFSVVFFFFNVFSRIFTHMRLRTFHAILCKSTCTCKNVFSSCFCSAQHVNGYLRAIVCICTHEVWFTDQKCWFFSFFLYWRMHSACLHVYVHRHFTINGLYFS